MTEEHAIRVCRLLVTLIEEVRGLRADLTHRRPRKPRPLSQADRDVLASLLPAAAAMFGEAEFLVGELMRRTGKEVTAGLNAMKLGRLFRRAADSGESIAGFYVHLTRHSRTGAVICVSAKTAEERAATRFATTMRGKLTP